MKKCLTVILSLMMVISLAACGGSGGSGDTGNGGSGNTGSSSTNGSSTSKNDEVFLEPFNTSPTIQETVLWDDNDVTVTAIDLTNTSWAVDLNLTLENTGDKDLNLYAGSISYSWNSVNGYMIDNGFFNEDIAPGESVEVNLRFDMQELQLHGINEIADIEFGIKGQDDDRNTFYMYPLKIETSAAASYDYSKDTYKEAVTSGIYERLGDYKRDLYSTEVLFDKNDISLISEAIFSDSENDRNLMMLEMQNLSEYPIYAQMSNIVINGLTAYDGAWSRDAISPGKYAIITSDIGRMLEDLNESEEIDLEEPLTYDDIETLTFTLSILNEDYNEALSPEDVTINFK